VILGPSGPVVVDWANARRGDPALDVALTWMILATSGSRSVPARLLLRRFLSHFDRNELLRALPVAAQRRISDANVTEPERARVRRYLARVGAPP
jgi:aminoglycoside phosphotransferase (APT) family kinase protein